MKIEQLDLIFLLAPKGFEHLTAVVIAPTTQIAKLKAQTVPEFQDAIDKGATISVLNITEHFGKQGYDIMVMKKGAYH